MFIKSIKVVKNGNSYVLRVDSEFKDQELYVMDKETFALLHKK